MMRIYGLLPLVFFFVMVLYIPIAAYAQDTGSISVEISYVNGDRASHYGISILVYQDANKQPFKEMKSIPSNPFDIVGLPIGHKYKIEVYSDNMHSSVVYVDLRTAHQDLNINIPLTGGMRVNAFYDDGQTPIDGAQITIKSQNNVTINGGVTDFNGHTMRFWLAPTLAKNDYYKIDVKVAPNLVYTLWPVFLSPGDRQEKKIVTDWPPLIDDLITVKVYGNQSDPVSTSDGKFVVGAYDSQGDKVSESAVNLRGEAYFYNLKVGEYTFKVINKTDGLQWGNTTVTMAGQKTEFGIYKDQPVNGTDDHPVKLVKQVGASMDNSQKTIQTDPTPDAIPKSGQGTISSDGIDSLDIQTLVGFPDWMKKDAKWWADGMISDGEFVKAIKFLIQMNNSA